MTSVIEISGKDIPADVYGVAYRFGERLSRSSDYMEYGSATMIAKRQGANVIVLVEVSGGAFLSIPRLISAGYAYPLNSPASDSQTLSIDEDGVSEVSRDDLVAGNVDWMGDEQVITWNGPAGRLLLIDRSLFFPGYTVLDEEVGINSYYTPFGPNIYAGGEISDTLPQYGVTPTKVLGSAEFDGKTVVVCSCNFRDVQNPLGGVGGFFEFLLIRDTVTEPINPFESSGWRVLWSAQMGAPTEIWRFNASGSEASRYIYKLTLTKNVSEDDPPKTTYSVTLSERNIVYGTGSETYAPDGSRTAWEYTAAANKLDYHDYLGSVEKSLSMNYSRSESMARHYDITSTRTDVLNGLPGKLTAPVFTILIVTGSGDPWDMGLGIQQNTTVSEVSCGCTTTDTWSRTGFDVIPCVPGHRQLVTATRSITCQDIGTVTQTVTRDFGPSPETGMGWVLADSVTYGSACVDPDPDSGDPCFTTDDCYFSDTIYTSGETLYYEAVHGVAGSVGCVCTFITPTVTHSCSGKTMTVDQRLQFTWQCLTGVPADQTYFYFFGNYGPAYVP